MATKSGREVGESGRGGLERIRDRFEIWKTGFDNAVGKNLEQLAGGAEKNSGGIGQDSSVHQHLVNKETVGTKETRKEPAIHNRESTEQQKILRRDNSNLSHRYSHESPRRIEVGTSRRDYDRQRGVLMELMLQFNKSGSRWPIFNQLDKRWLEDDELKTRLTEAEKRATSAASNFNKPPISERVHQLFELYTGIQLEKARCHNEIRKRVVPELEKLFVNRYKHVDEDVGLLWLAKSHEDIERAYSQDDPDEMDLVKFLGIEYEHYYDLLRRKKIRSMKGLLELMENCKTGMFTLLEADICNTTETWIESYHSKIWEVLTNEKAYENLDDPILVKVMDEIKAVLVRENTERVRIEKESVRRAIDHAVGKYCELMESKLEGILEVKDVQILHGKLKESVVQSFYSVPDFTYPEMWKLEERNVMTKIEEEYKTICDSLQPRIERFLSQKEEAISNIITEFDLRYLELLEGKKSETEHQTRVTKLVEEAISRLDSKFASSTELYARILLSIEAKTRLGQSRSESLLPEMETESPKCQNHETLLESTSVATNESLIKSEVHYNLPGPSSKRKSHGLHDNQAPMELSSPPKLSKLVQSPGPGTSTTQSHLESSRIPVILNQFEVGSNSTESARECSVAIAFFGDELMVQVHRDNHIKNFSMPARFTLVQKDKALPYIDVGEFQNSNIFENVFAYQLLTQHNRAKSYNEYFVEGHMRKLWSDELLALLFSKLRQKLQESYQIDCTNQHIAFGIPESLSSACRQRLKTALQLSGLPLVKLVHFTTAIAIYHSQVAQVEDTDPYHALAILVQPGIFDVAVFRHENMHLEILAFSSFETPLGTDKKETRADLESKLCDCVNDVLELGNFKTPIKYCRAVVDIALLTRKNPDWSKNHGFRTWFRGTITRVVPPGTVVDTGPSHEGIMEGLNHVFKHLGKTQPPIVCFADRFSRSYFVTGSNPHPPIQIVLRNQLAQKLIKCIPVSDLMKLEPPVKIASGDSSTPNIDVIFSSIECASPGAVMRVELTDEAILKLSFEDGNGQSLVYQPRWTVQHLFTKPSLLEGAQKLVEDILRLSGRWMSADM